MITDGHLLEARKYIVEMISMANEMGDIEGQENYKKYEAILTQASMNDSRRLSGKEGK